MGLLVLTEGRPGHVVACPQPGEEYRLRLSAATGRPTEPDRHLLVRIPFSDKRADNFVHDEAKQLPHGFPELIMIDVGEAPGAFRNWEP